MFVTNVIWYHIQETLVSEITITNSNIGLCKRVMVWKTVQIAKLGLKSPMDATTWHVLDALLNGAGFAVS